MSAMHALEQAHQAWERSQPQLQLFTPMGGGGVERTGGLTAAQTSAQLGGAPASPDGRGTERTGGQHPPR